MKAFWVVWIPGLTGPTKHHPTKEKALEELSGLLLANQAMCGYVLQAVARATVYRTFMWDAMKGV